MKKIFFTIAIIFSTITFLIFTIGVNNGGATQNNVTPEEASFDGLIFIGDTMDEVLQQIPDLELTYLEGWALVDMHYAYIFNDDGILVLIAKKLDDSNWDWLKKEGTKYEDDGYFLGKTRYEIIKDDLLFTFYENENQNIVTLEKVAEKKN
ncbi:hypothetical protein RJD24_02940 [Bacillaceae bacterium IKA-2]|nr:hypothetical protein RJD24_02940 [Bacillaceae bacterium IKA-2]